MKFNPNDKEEVKKEEERLKLIEYKLLQLRDKEGFDEYLQLIKDYRDSVNEEWKSANWEQILVLKGKLDVLDSLLTLHEARIE